MVISGFVQAAFVVTGEGVVLVDAPPALDGKLQAAIASVTDQQVTHFIYTHSHLDHVGAVTKFPGARRIAHEEAARLLANHDDPARPLPDQVIDGPRTVLTIGGEEVQLIYPGPNHEVGNILVHFPAQKLSVMTDVVMPGWAPYRGWGNADYPPGMPAAHDAILATDFDTYVGGHVYRTGTRADVQQSRDFLLDTIHTTQKAMGSISYADAAAGIEPANAWAVVTVWFGRIAEAVTTELTERWRTKIAAWTPSPRRPSKLSSYPCPPTPRPTSPNRTRPTQPGNGLRGRGTRSSGTAIKENHHADSPWGCACRESHPRL